MSENKNDFAELARQVAQTRAEETQARQEGDAAERELRALREHFAAAANAAAGHERGERAGSAAKLEESRAEQAELAGLIDLAERRLAAARTRAAEARARRAALRAGRELDLAAWAFHAATAKVAEAERAVETLQARLGPAGAVAAGAERALERAEAERALALEDGDIRAARQRVELARAARDDAKSLVENLRKAEAAAAADRAAAWADAEKARRAVWACRRAAILADLKAACAQPLLAAFVAAHAAGESPIFSYFGQAFLAGIPEPSPAALAETRAALSEGVGVPARPDKARPS